MHFIDAGIADIFSSRVRLRCRAAASPPYYRPAELELSPLLRHAHIASRAALLVPAMYFEIESISVYFQAQLTYRELLYTFQMHDDTSFH